MITMLPPEWNASNTDKATTQLQKFLRQTTPVLKPEGVDFHASSIYRGDG